MTKSRERVQVCVIGGGPAGAAAALLLARAGVRTLLVDDTAGREREGWKIGEGLPPSGSRVLQMLGVWERFLTDGHLPSYGNRSVWGSPHPEEQDFLFHPHGNGWHLDRAKFDAMLRQAAAYAGSVLWADSRVTAAEESVGGWLLQIESAGDRTEWSCAAEFVVDATGRNAWLARQLGVERVLHDRMVGIAAVLESERAGQDEDTYTVIEAVESGWWYTAKVPGNKRVVARLGDGDLPQTKAARDVDAWRAELAQTLHAGRAVEEFGYRIDGPLRLFNANSSQLSRVYGDGWLAIGDAAAAYDPLSSQGILMAIGTAMEAARAIQEHRRGAAEALPAYEEFVHRIYLHYLNMRSQYYELEQRWATHSFWTRRFPARIATM